MLLCLLEQPYRESVDELPVEMLCCYRGKDTNHATIMIYVHFTALGEWMFMICLSTFSLY